MATTYRLLQPDSILYTARGPIKPLRPVLNTHHPINRSLTGCWLLNDAQTGYAKDLSSHNNDGLISFLLQNGTRQAGQTTFVATSHHRGLVANTTDPAILPSGAGQYWDCGTDSSLVLDNNGWSLVAWYMQTIGGSLSRIISNVSGDGLGHPQNGGEIFLDGQTPAMKLATGGSTNQLDLTSQPQNVWIFVVATYDGATASISINAGTPATLSASNACGTSSASMQIGTYPGATGIFEHHSLFGLIDAVRVYRRVLTKAEIIQLYYEPYAGIWDATLNRQMAVPGAAPPANFLHSDMQLWG